MTFSHCRTSFTGSHVPFRQSDWELDSNDGDNNNNDKGSEDIAMGYSADHILVLLDCGASMWKGVFRDPEYPDDLLSPVDKVLQVLTTFLKKEIRNRETWKTGRRNGFGLYLYNTEPREHIEWDSPLKKRRTAAPEESHQQAASAIGHSKDAYDDDEEVDDGYDNDDGDDGDDDDNGPSYTVDRKTTVHRLIPMEPPGIATIQTLKAVQDDGVLDREFDIEENYAPKTDDHDPDNLALQMAFMMAGQILQEAKCVHTKPKDDRPPDRVRIWIITNQETASEYAMAAGKDLVDMQFEIELWPLPHPDKDFFDYQARFESMKYIQRQTDALSKKELIKWWETEALTDVLDSWKVVRPIHRLPMLWPGEQETDEETAYLQLHWYRLVQTAHRPSKIVVHQETGLQLNAMSQIVENGDISQEILYEKVTGDNDSTPKVSPRLCTYVEVQNTRIPLSEREKIELKAKSHPHKFASLRVIGFRPADSIDRTTASIEQPYFCIPPDDTESRVKGSRPAFSAIHKAMMNKNALMLGEVLTRKSATTRLVAAWALPELIEHDEDDGEEDIIHPAGLLVIVLPWRNEIKKPISDATTKAAEPLVSKALVEEAKMIVNGLTVEPRIGFHFPNKSLELFWEKLEELALNERKSGKDDETVMSQEDFVKHVGENLDRFMDLLPEDLTPVKKKREREKVPDESGIDWLEAYSKETLGSYKVDELKMYLKSVGEKTTGRKQELIERMMPHLKKALEESAKPS